MRPNRWASDKSPGLRPGCLPKFLFVWVLNAIRSKMAVVWPRLFFTFPATLAEQILQTNGPLLRSRPFSVSFASRIDTPRLPSMAAKSFNRRV